MQTVSHDVIALGSLKVTDGGHCWVPNQPCGSWTFFCPNTSYKIKFSADIVKWEEYKENDAMKVFDMV